MKNFLETQILFPKKYGAIPYVYLLFITPAFAGLFSNHTTRLWLTVGIVLLLLFLKFYRDGYDSSAPHQLRYIILQLMVASFFALNPWITTYGFHIFTGFTIGFSAVSDRRYRQYLWLYFASAIPTYLITLAVNWKIFDITSWSWILVSIVFAFISPFFARVISKSVALDSKNKVLEEKVRQLERERIAFDLHDTVGQAFSTITLQAELVEKLIDKDSERAKEEIQKLAENSRQNLSLVREIVSDLREESLAQVLEEEKQALELAGIGLRFEGDLSLLPDKLSPILKESLSNVIHHSQATVVLVKASENRLLIADNGKGLADSHLSHGLFSMKKRAEDMGAEFSLVSDRGTKIEVKL